MAKKKVLAIDDERIVLDSIKKILDQEDYEIDLTQNSREGLEMALERGYDLVLSDIRMPDIGGMRILRDIKRAKPSTAVIIITGYATVQSAVQAMKLGAQEFIEKPFTPDLLLEAVHNAFSKAAVAPHEEQALVHKAEVIKILERAVDDSVFVADLYYKGADALEEYDLTGPEKLALLTGDITWIESYIGPLTEKQRKWLEQRLSAEVW